MKIINTILLWTMMMTSICALSACKKDKTTVSKTLSVDVMSEEYGAKGDGKTSDRAAIQKAIDEVNASGGGKVILASGHTFLSGNLILKSNVELSFGKDTILLQNSDPTDYIEVRGYDYGDGFVKIGEHYTPIVGMSLIPYNDEYDYIWPESTEKWRECWYWNYPLIYADKGTENIKITGNGTIQSQHFDMDKLDSIIYMHLIGFYGVNNFVVSGLKFRHETSHCMNFYNCNNGIVMNVETWTEAADSKAGVAVASICDGIKLINCQDIVVSDSTFASGDDSFLIISSYNDTRYDRWASSSDIQPVKNIEVARCNLPTYFKGLGFCTLGMMSKNREMVEISDIYIHDCNFCSVGMWEGWGWNNLTGENSPNYGYYNPMKNIRWENNNYEYWIEEYNYSRDSKGISKGLSDYPVSDCISDNPLLHSMVKMYNTDFKDGLSYWIQSSLKEDAVEIKEKDGNCYASLSQLNNGSVKLYEGIYLESGKHTFKVRVVNSEAKGRLFVTDQSDNIIAVKEIDSTNDWIEMTFDFNLLSSGNYRIGIESYESSNGYLFLDDVSLD